MVRKRELNLWLLTTVSTVLNPIGIIIALIIVNEIVQLDLVWNDILQINACVTNFNFSDSFIQSRLQYKVYSWFLNAPHILVRRLRFLVGR